MNQFLFTSVSQIVTWGLPIIEYLEGLLKHDMFLDPTLEPLNRLSRGEILRF